MFRNSIQKTALTDDIAERYFEGRITGSPIGNDYSFVATLRALFERRMPEGESLRFVFSSSSRRASEVEEYPVRDLVSNAVYNSGTVVLHSFVRGDPDSNAAYIRAADAYYSAEEGWEKLPKPTEYYARTMQVLVFVNPELKSVLILMDSSDLRKVHFLEAGVLSFFPWYFNPEDGFSAGEKALCESLMKTTPDAYLEALAAIAAVFDFRKKVEKKILSEFESRFDRDKVNRIMSDIQDVDRNINSLEDQISEYLSRRYDYELTLAGLEEKLKSGSGSEFCEYFTSNKSLVLLGSSGDSVDFAARGRLTYWDDDAAARIVENRNSFLYGRGSIPDDDMYLLYRAIFVEKTIGLRWCAAFRIRPGSRLERLEGYAFPADEFGTYMPNTHIDRYGCIGNNESVINAALKVHDYISVAEQAVASALGFNFADSTVGRRFAALVSGGGSDGGYTVNVKAFELPDGTVTDPRGAIEWLKAQREGEDNDEERTETEA